MTTDNGATAGAVADPEVEPTTQAEPTTAETTSPETGAGEETAGAVSPESNQAEGTESTSDGETDVLASVFEAFDAELGNLGGEPVTPQESTPRAGEPLEAFQARQKAIQVNRHAALRNGADMGIVEAVMDEFGVTKEQAQAFWDRRARPHFNNAISDSDQYWEAFDGWFVSQLPEAEQKAFKSRVYNGPQEWRQGLIDTGKDLKEDEYQEKIKAGELVPKTAVAKAMTSAKQAARAEFERLAKERGWEYGTSGNVVNGETSGRKPYSQLDFETRSGMTDAERDAYIASHG